MLKPKTYDPTEIAKFDALSDKWWDVEGELKTLHAINPVRLQYIQKHIDLTGRKVLDIGCGGGILSESLAKAGAVVTGVDMSESAIKAAQAHKKLLNIKYINSSAQELLTDYTNYFDCIVCMELLEHVPNPEELIKFISKLATSGADLFLSTINRSAKAYLTAILGAEYILNILPRKTHDYDKFIRPSELSAWLRNSNIDTCDITGLSYNPFSNQARLSRCPEVNYLLHAIKI